MSHAVQGHQDGWVIVKGSDKTQFTKKEMAAPLQYSCLENPMDSMKRQKRYNAGRGASPGWKVCNMLGKSGEQSLIAPERKKWLGQSENDAQLWMCLLAKVNLML